MADTVLLPEAMPPVRPTLAVAAMVGRIGACS
jgi:hypothetical protein